MAELVDALVSNTNEVTLVPVRLRPKVQLYIKSLANRDLRGSFVLATASEAEALWLFGYHLQEDAAR